jgi:hypothetical protein
MDIAAEIVLKAATGCCNRHFPGSKRRRHAEATAAHAGVGPPGAGSLHPLGAMTADMRI